MCAHINKCGHAHQHLHTLTHNRICHDLQKVTECQTLIITPQEIQTLTKLIILNRSIVICNIN